MSCTRTGVTEPPRLSVIIPCRDDARPLARLLPQISADNEDQVEIIVVCDADQRDEIKTVCTDNGAQCVVLNEPRGVRLRKGAELASAPNYWFLHADSELQDNAVKAVMQAFSDGHIGGYFRFRLLGPRSLRKRCIEYAVAIRCRFGGIPYGDQALFVTAAEYPIKYRSKTIQTLFSSNGKEWNFERSKAPNSAITGLEIFKNGDVLVLERSYRMPFMPVVINLRRIQLDQCDKEKHCTAEAVARFDTSEGWSIDNFEGLAHYKDNQFFMVSDDNNSLFQKTILVLFEVIDAEETSKK